MTYWYWIALGWAVCGFLAYGRTLAHFQRAYPLIADTNRGVDYQFALWQVPWGPISLLVVFFTYRHGFMWRLPPRKDG